MNSSKAQLPEDLVINWIQNAKPTATIGEIRNSDLIEARLLDSMQFLDFVYFLNELCASDISSVITVDDMRTLPRIVSFIEIQQRGRMVS